MKFTTPTKFLLLVTAVALVASPGSTFAQKGPEVPAAPGDTTTTPAGATTTPPVPTVPPTTTTTTTTTVPIVPTVPTVPTFPTIPTNPTSTVPPVVTTAPPVIPPVVTTTSSPAVPTFTPPATLAPCANTSTCKDNEYCGVTAETLKNSTVMGYCLPMTSGIMMCLASPVQPCTSHSQCNTLGFGYCDIEKTHNCAGMGIPETQSECRSGTLVGGGSQSSSGDSNDKLTSTLKYAGIGIGSVALLGIVFAVVRWRSNKRKRSRKMPDFADVDYGMSTTAARSKSHRQRPSEPRSSAGGDGGQSYPFSNRPVVAGAAAVGVGVGAGALAAGAATADQEFYSDQYYDDGYAQHSKGGYDNYGNQAGGYDNYGYGQGGYDQGYDQQGYDQQGYYKEAGAVGGYEGYDQHGNYIGDQTGYYDQQGYDYSQQQQDYQYPSTSGVDASGAVVASGAGAAVAGGAMDGSGVAYPAEVAAVSPRRNGATEMMPEQDFGNSAASGAGYGRHY